MIRASRSPSSRAATPSSFSVGPLEVRVTAPSGPLNDLIRATLELYDVPWSLTARRHVQLDAGMLAHDGARPAAGDYLVCAQMLVDCLPGGALRATTTDGATLVEERRPDGEDWRLEVPQSIQASGRWVQVEDLLSLVATTGWRRAGWVPLHAAGLVRDQRGLIVCAGSGGGKTTFTVAMLRRGWGTTGDDKLLLGIHGGAPVLAGIKHVLNLDPKVAAWFPEVGDIAAEPLYSAWSPKRRVPLARFWPDAPAVSMAATHALVLQRSPSGPAGVTVRRLGPGEVIAALLRQTVIPSHPSDARPIVRAITRLAQRVTGLAVQIGDDVYADPEAMRRVERALA